MTILESIALVILILACLAVIIMLGKVIRKL